MELQQDIERLKKNIEEKVGCKISTPKDFDYLSARISEQTHTSVSVSTLKRLWGYVSGTASPRRSTLDVLSLFLGAKDWDAFRSSTANDDASPTPQPYEPKSPEPIPEKRANWLGMSHRKAIAVNTSILSILVIAMLFFLLYHKSDSNREAYILRCGQSFHSTEEYLRLFGVTDTLHPWSEPLPHHNSIIIWGPMYHHPEWHNEGNADSLMPTITEYWTPTDTTGYPHDAVTSRNADNYLRVTTFKELRITFMKDVQDSTYTFLGIYRLDHSKSDSTILVWERVAKDCDLSNLDYLEQLRL
ncbi:MAG: hypothetical protein IKG99_07335 [Bacteroidaceae bacterium]|nr:hypothetical protein [Bacteroidaceae bacterium]